MADAGRVLLMGKGDYNSGVTYNVLDFVRYNGASWVCKVDGTVNVTPAPGANWQLLAQDGSGGGGGGSVDNAYKNIKVGSTTITAFGEDTLELVAGSNVTLTPDASLKKVTIASSGGGGSTGDMLASDYDSDLAVKTAGGIKSYVTTAISGKADSSSLATVATSGSYNDLSNKPTIPAAQIQSDWNQADTTAKDFIKNKPSNLGHTMIDTVSDISALTDGDDDYVVNGYAVKQWSNVDDIQLLVAVSAGDDGVGTWESDSAWETGSRTGWIQHTSLYGILSSDDVEVEPVFIVSSGTQDAVSLYAIRVDDGITGSLGGIAMKFNAPIAANGYVGIRIRHLRTNTIILTP